MYPCSIWNHGTSFSSSEQLYQFEKASFHNLFSLAERIRRTTNPFLAKRLTKNIQVKSTWHEAKASIMHKIVMDKSV
jgi:predicted NAD-dependent protein-ADP-ribosyltransferase YbiA (DUF1768 family)